MSYERSTIRAHRVMRLVLMLLIGVLTAMLLLKVGLSVTGQTVLPVRTVQVSGNRYLSNSDVISLLGPETGTSMLFLKPKKVEQAVLQDSRIRRAQVAKVYPDTLRVYVREKEAAAVLNLGDAAYLVSRDGVVLTHLQAGEDDRIYSDYPFISLLSKDDDIKIGNPVHSVLLISLLDSLLQFRQEQPDFSRRIESYAVDEVGIWAVMGDLPYRIYLGSEVSVEKFNRLRALIIVLEQTQAKKGGGTTPLEIDMSFSQAAVREGDYKNES